ncbi:hypothetical protein RCL1_005318 [Eukaryota sp. TZLM3-RCL]
MSQNPEKPIPRASQHHEQVCHPLSTQVTVTEVPVGEGAIEEVEILYEPVSRTTIKHQEVERVTRVDEPISSEEAHERREFVQLPSTKREKGATAQFKEPTRRHA